MIYGFERCINSFIDWWEIVATRKRSRSYLIWFWCGLGGNANNYLDKLNEENLSAVLRSLKLHQEKMNNCKRLLELEELNDQT